MYPSSPVREILKKLSKEGFDISKMITREDNIEKNSVIYRQKKYIVPKRKKYEKT